MPCIWLDYDLLMTCTWLAKYIYMTSWVACKYNICLWALYFPSVCLEAKLTCLWLSRNCIRVANNLHVTIIDLQLNCIELEKTFKWFAHKLVMTGLYELNITSLCACITFACEVSYHHGFDFKLVFLVGNDLHITCIRLAYNLHMTCIWLEYDLLMTCIWLGYDLQSRCIWLA